MKLMLTLLNLQNLPKMLSPLSWHKYPATETKLLRPNCGKPWAFGGRQSDTTFRRGVVQLIADDWIASQIVKESSTLSSHAENSFTAACLKMCNYKLILKEL